MPSMRFRYAINWSGNVDLCESRAEGARPRQAIDDLLMRESPKRHREHNPAKTRDRHETRDDPRRND